MYSTGWPNTSRSMNAGSILRFGLPAKLASKISTSGLCRASCWPGIRLEPNNCSKQYSGNFRPSLQPTLQIMIALGLDDRDTYMGAEVSAENTLLERMQAQAGPGVSVQALDHLTVKDTDCAVNNGSSMIALANIVSRVFPQNPQEKILFALPEASDGFSQFMAFTQLSLMGFSAYTVPGQFAIWDINGDATFAPRNAICSPGFFSDYWNDARLEAILSANGVE